MADKAQVILVNEADHTRLVLPRNPPGFQDDQRPEYDGQHTPAGAEYQAQTFKHGGPRTFNFTFVLLPEIDGAAKITEAMRFIFNLVRPTNYTDPQGVTRFEPPDVSMIYGGMVRRGKITRRPVSYSHLDKYGVAREIVVQFELTSYVRAVPPAGSAGQEKPDYEKFQRQNVDEFLKAEKQASLQADADFFSQNRAE